MIILVGEICEINLGVAKNCFQKYSKPFCEQYWGNLAKSDLIRQSKKDCVSLHGHLNGINHHFISRANPENLDKEFFATKITPRQMITKTDFEFKTIAPTDQKIVVYRCIGEKPEFFSEYSLYNKSLNVQKSDTVVMKEYAYATSDLSYANVYLPNRRGILYEIEIPEGAKVSRTGYGVRNEIVFPRSSRFKCTDMEKIKNDNEEYLRVKLQYIKPKDPFAK